MDLTVTENGFQPLTLEEEYDTNGGIGIVAVVCIIAGGIIGSSVIGYFIGKNLGESSAHAQSSRDIAKIEYEKNLTPTPVPTPTPTPGITNIR